MFHHVGFSCAVHMFLIHANAQIQKYGVRRVLLVFRHNVSSFFLLQNKEKVRVEDSHILKPQKLSSNLSYRRTGKKKKSPNVLFISNLSR